MTTRPAPARIAKILRRAWPRPTELVSAVANGQRDSSVVLLAAISAAALALVFIAWNGIVVPPLGLEPTSSVFEIVLLFVVAGLIGRPLGAIAMLYAAAMPFIGVETFSWAGMSFDSPQVVLFGAFMLGAGWLIAGSADAGTEHAAPAPRRAAAAR